MASTLKTLQALLENRAERHGLLEIVPKIECADGLKLSVQAGRTHYCEPRNNAGPWHMVEVGFPTARVEELMPYAEDAERPTETVYGYVPMMVLVRAIDSHGGFATRVYA